MLISSEIGSRFLCNWIRHHTEGLTGIVDMGAGKFDKLNWVHPDCYQRRAGIEIHQPSINQSTIEDVQKIQGDFLEYPSYVNPKEFPGAMFIDTIEHVEKQMAIELIQKCQLDFERILIMTPDGEDPQEEVRGNIYQRHLSTWSPADFNNLGFQLILTYPFFHPANRHGNGIIATTGAIFARWDKS